ncbi:MAG: PH domain-containing protein [Anaerolineales bacterium]|mgnify:CR=1 FL=1|nr:PH domain-containing protein [Anaerolineales bacterium]
MSYVRKLLAQNEEIVRIVRPHWIRLLPAIAADLVVAIVIVALSALGTVISPPYTWLGLLLLVVPVGHFLIRLWAWRKNETVVTSQRIIRTTGVFRKEVSDTLIEKINDITTRQTTLGRMLNYGDLALISGSESGIDTFSCIPDPNGFKRALVEQQMRVQSPAIAPADAQGAQAMRPDDIPELILELEGLYHKGLLTEQEFTEKKRELLARI